MMVGIPGAGKSFFARQFSEMFSSPLISYDQIYSLLFVEPEFNKDEEIVVETLCDIQCRQLFMTGKSFIIDGGLGTRVSRHTVEQLARKYGFTTLVVWVQTDIPTAQLRSMKRSNRRQDDQYNTSLSAEVFDKATRRLNPPSQREKYIVVSGKHTFSSQAKVVLQSIVAPRDTALVPAPERADSVSKQRHETPRQQAGRRGIVIN